tara:strand:+ start:2171 stop:2863 length:693 start_codon:yes stop_codon:yes gene_type:complete
MISFIVPAYNEEEYIGATIVSINSSMKGFEVPYEIIVVNDNSEDKTKEIALKFDVNVIDANCRQLGKVRNVGASHAKGSVLVFVDADTGVTGPVIKEVLSKIDTHKAGCAYGVYYDLDQSPFHKRMMGVYTWFCSKVWKVCSGYFMWCNAENFKDGFDEEYYLFEDVWFSRKFHKRDFYFGKERVLTSGRKAWTHNFLLRIVPFLFKYSIKGNKLLKNRSSLGMWYDGVR